MSGCIAMDKASSSSLDILTMELSREKVLSELLDASEAHPFSRWRRFCASSLRAERLSFFS
jgi:hypothetical protein